MLSEFNLERPGGGEGRVLEKISTEMLVLLFSSLKFDNLLFWGLLKMRVIFGGVEKISIIFWLTGNLHYSLFWGGCWEKKLPNYFLEIDFHLLFYTYLQNKRMRRCGVAPPPIFFERLKLPQQIIYRRKENLSESPNHQNIGKIFWFRDFMSNFSEVVGF